MTSKTLAKSRLCAAVSAARNGAKVALVQDRSVLGGNASSEIRVIVHGVTRMTNGLADRETGIIEEILLHNRFLNQQDSFPVWDHILYDFVVREPNIELLLDTQAIRAEMEGDRIVAARCWQGPSETVITLQARQSIDCPGDGLLAATAGAFYRTGREAKDRRCADCHEQDPDYVKALTAIQIGADRLKEFPRIDMLGRKAFMDTDP